MEQRGSGRTTRAAGLTVLLGKLICFVPCLCAGVFGCSAWQVAVGLFVITDARVVL